MDDLVGLIADENPGRRRPDFERTKPCICRRGVVVADVEGESTSFGRVLPASSSRNCLTRFADGCGRSSTGCALRPSFDGDRVRKGFDSPGTKVGLDGERCRLLIVGLVKSAFNGDRFKPGAGSGFSSSAFEGERLSDLVTGAGAARAASMRHAEAWLAIESIFLKVCMCTSLKRPAFPFGFAILRPCVISP
jgi:hypothetical protein